MQVIRVEGKFGYGMFRKDYGIEQYQYIPSSMIPELGDRHGIFPTPDDDCINMKQDGKEWFCGYKNVDQFQQWVLKSELEIMFKEGFKVWMLEVTQFQIGLCQIVFTKESIRSKTDITELFI